MPVTVLPFVQQFMIRYIMSTYFAFGLIGNICNCIVFCKQVSRQRTPCSVYLLALSIFAFIYLLWSIVPLLYTLDHIDPQVQSLAYCKVRLYGSHVLGQFVRFTVLFACADRFFITRSNAHIRAWSSFKNAKRMVAVMCIVWIVVGLHLPTFMEIRGGVCWMFDFYKFFYPIYQFTLVGFTPPALMSVFGYLTVRTLSERHAANEHIRQKDRDLMRMLIAEIMVNIVTSIPFSANLLYGTATFYVFLIHLLSVAPFYLFVISSKSFRREFIHTLLGWWYRYVLRRTRILPITDHTTATIGH